MPEHLPPELVELREAAVLAASGPLQTLETRHDLDHRSLRAEVVAVSRAAGLFELTRPVDDRPPALALVVVRETLGFHNVAHLPGLFGPQPGLLAGVEEPLRSRYLEPMLAGQLQGAFGFTEPDDATRHTWAAVDGDDLIVNGQKSYVTGGANADFINTLVETDGEGPAMVVIDTDRAGVEIIRRFESLDGSRHAAFRFTDVRVPRSNVVGPPGKGMSRAMDQVGQVRMGIAATCVGLTGYAVDYVERYLAAPHRSGTPLGQSERHRLRLGQMRIAAFGARSALYRTARLIDDGQNAVNEIMATKHLATETVGHVVDSAIQTVGGQALTDGHPLVGIHRRVRSQRLAEGASDVLAMNVARGRLDLNLGRI